MLVIEKIELNIKYLLKVFLIFLIFDIIVVSFIFLYFFNLNLMLMIMVMRYFLYNYIICVFRFWWFFIKLFN